MTPFLAWAQTPGIIFDSLWDLFFGAVALHALASVICNSLSYSTLSVLRLTLACRPWERGGQFWQDWFAIRSWKDKVPVFGAFDKKHFEKDSKGYVSLFALESTRAEVVHYLCIVLTAGLFAATRIDAPWWMWVFFVLINAPCAMIQRYNRPRLERALRMKGQELEIPETRRRRFRAER